MNESTETTTAPSTAAASAPPAASGNVGTAVLWGLLAAVVGAIAWAVITVKTEYQIGFMAIGVGLLVGYAVRKFGHGSTPTFGIVGGACALFGCVLGNLLSGCGFIAAQENVSLIDVMTGVFTHLDAIVELMKEMFNPMDLLFYGIAVYEGYKVALNPSASS